MRASGVLRARPPVTDAIAKSGEPHQWTPGTCAGMRAPAQRGAAPPPLPGAGRLPARASQRLRPLAAERCRGDLPAAPRGAQTILPKRQARGVSDPVLQLRYSSLRIVSPLPRFVSYSGVAAPD